MAYLPHRNCSWYHPQCLRNPTGGSRYPWGSISCGAPGGRGGDGGRGEEEEKNERDDKRKGGGKGMVKGIDKERERWRKGRREGRGGRGERGGKGAR